MSDKKTNTVSLVGFILSLLFFIPFSGIAAFILGLIGIGQIKERDEAGNGFAVTATVIGSLSLLFWFFAVIGSL